MALKEKDINTTRSKDHHHGRGPALANDDDLVSSQIRNGPPAASADAVNSAERLDDLFLASDPLFVSDHQRAEERPPVAAPAPEPPETDQAWRCLHALGIDLWKARQLAKAHSLSLITQTVANLKHRSGTVRHPAAWVIRELERGGYTPPRRLVEQRERQAQQAAQALQQRREEAERAELGSAHNQKAAQLLDGYSLLPAERQEALLQEVRRQLSRVSPRLAAAPLDLENPGPLRSQLLELLEGLALPSRLAGATSREGGWGQFRRASDASSDRSGIAVLASSVDAPC